jgi:hypothetical protein
MPLLEVFERHKAIRNDGMHTHAITVTLGSHELIVSPEQVARYAGGTRYHMDASLEKLVQTILAKAYELVEPAFVYRVHKVAGFLERGFVKLHNGVIFPVPTGEQDSGMKALAFCICTIGGRLEEATKASSSPGDLLGSLFLDAAGVAFLEALSTRAHETLQQHAQEHQLQVGCRFGPGYGGMDLSYQERLFELVDALSIGVWLNESCVMSPSKSLSFVTIWTSSPGPQRSRYKCASCNLTHCPYWLDGAR